MYIYIYIYIINRMKINKRDYSKIYSKNNIASKIV